MELIEVKDLLLVLVSWVAMKILDTLFNFAKGAIKTDKKKKPHSKRRRKGKRK